MVTPTENKPGVGINGRNGVSVDPTRNVTDLVHASVRRSDDLMAANMRRIDEVAEERVKRLEGEQSLRAEYHDKLMVAEAKRIDAIRATDVAAATLANERATQQADILARQVAQTAETLRALVDSTAKQIATQHEVFGKALGERVTLLEQKQYEAQGRSRIADPQQSEFVGELKRLRDTSTLRTGRSEGMSAVWGYIIAFLSAVSMAISVGHILFSKG